MEKRLKKYFNERLDDLEGSLQAVAKSADTLEKLLDENVGDLEDKIEKVINCLTEDVDGMMGRIESSDKKVEAMVQFFKDRLAKDLGDLEARFEKRLTESLNNMEQRFLESTVEILGGVEQRLEKRITEMQKETIQVREEFVKKELKVSEKRLVDAVPRTIHDVESHHAPKSRSSPAKSSLVSPKSSPKRQYNGVPFYLPNKRQMRRDLLGTNVPVKRHSTNQSDDMLTALEKELDRLKQTLVAEVTRAFSKFLEEPAVNATAAPRG